jgi:hypothetical protein
MPCATVHMQLSQRIFRRWREVPTSAPIPLSDPRVEEAFLHGAMAPDMGFIPGADRLVSEVAHYLRPGDLARALLRGAGSPVEEAFAWGWASHVLGDVELHPVVGRAVGEFLYGDPDRRVDAAENVEAHVSLEVGLDLCIYHTDRRDRGELPRPPAVPHFRGSRIRHLARALEETYGLPWDGTDLLRAHQRATRLTAWWPRALEALALRRGSRPEEPGVRPVRWFLDGARAFTRTGSAARGFLGVRIPPGWVMEEVDRRMEGFEDRFQGLVDSGLEGMENRNLETGEAAGPGLGHPASDEVAARVERIRSTPSLSIP